MNFIIFEPIAHALELEEGEHDTEDAERGEHGLEDDAGVHGLEDRGDAAEEHAFECGVADDQGLVRFLLEGVDQSRGRGR
jgi:hypothetical protein